MPATQPNPCGFLNCLVPTARPRKRHGWHYHITPVAFQTEGSTLCFRVEEGKLICPFPKCSASMNRRDRATKHVRDAHGLNEGVRIFEEPLASSENEEDVDAFAGPAVLDAAIETSYDAQVPGPVDESGGNQWAPGRVALGQGVEYLQGGGVLDALGIWFHHGLRVFICRACQICQTSETVKGHCKGQHEVAITATVTEQLQAFIERHQVYKRPQDVPLPRPGGPVVQGLSPPQTGLACGFEGCPYSVKDGCSMRKHERSEHGRGALQPFMHRESKVQALFLGVGKVYFEVEEFAKEGEEALLRTALEHVGVSSDAAIATDKDRTPPALLRVTGWADHLPEVRASRTLRAEALALKAKRTVDELGGILPGLEVAVGRCFERGRTVLNGHASKLTVLKVLMHGPDVPSEGAKHWKPVPASNEEYAGFVSELVTAVFRSSLRPSSSGAFSFALSEEQGLSLRALEDALRKGDADGAASCCQRFLWSITSAKVGGGWTDVTQRWTWLRALRPDGNFYGSSSFTPDLAKLKYMMRQTTLLQAFLDPLRSDEELIQRVGRLHASVLAMGAVSPFKMVTELSQYASSLVLAEVKDPKVTISGDYESFTVGTQTMSLGRLREGLGKLSQGIWIAYDDIVQCDRVVPVDVHVVDDLSNDTRGYSFLEERPFREKRRKMFYHLVDIYQLAAIDYAGSVCWDVPKVKSLLAKCGRMWDNVLHLLFMTLGVSTRVAQFLRTQIRNGDRQRNIQFRNGEMYFVTRDSKTSNASGRDSCIPAFPPSQVSRLLLELVGGGLREAEALLTGIAYGEEAMEVHRTYLCMREGKRLEPDQFYSRFLAKNRETFDCAWGSRDYRQAAIAMARHFISADATFAALEDALAEAADHSTDVDRTHYGRTFGDHPRLTHGDIERQRWVCQEWHSFLGLGPFPIQEPIVTVRRRGGSRIDKEAAKSALLDILPELSSAIADAVTKKLERSIPHANAASVSSRPPAAIEPAFNAGVAMETEVTAELHPSTVRASVRMSDPAAAPSSSRRPHGPISAFPKRVTHASGSKQKLVTEPVVVTREFSVLDLTLTPSSSPLTPVPDEQEALHRTPSPAVALPASSSQPIALARQRKRRGPEPADSDLEGELETPQKRVRRHTGAPVQSIFDPLSDTEGPSSLADFIAASTPDPVTVDQEELIRQVIRRMYGNPTAREKSMEQMEALLAIMNEDERDLVVIMRTGGGKSLLWTVPPLLDIEGISVVICPFKTLMEEQYQRCVKAGVRCQSYSVSKEVREDVQNLFLQVEHVSADAFLTLCVSPLGKQIRRVFVDEFHDIGQCHPNRRTKWQALAKQCSMMQIQLILLSATCPPSMANSLLLPYNIRNKDQVNFIRGPTDRPEIGIHYIKTLYTMDSTPLHSIVNRLHSMLRPEERMLVFFNSKVELAKFASKAGCAVYHSDLCSRGNTKEDNLQRWDEGETKVMACTTGFAQGVDRPHVRFVVMKDPEYGLLVTMQMIGRAGRDGKESHAFVVDTEGGQTFPCKDLTASSTVKNLLGDDRQCRVLTTTAALDGGARKYRCKEEPGRVACDVCHPNHPIHQAVVAASKVVTGPIMPLGGVGRLGVAQPERAKWVRASCRPAAQGPPLSGVIVRPASNVDSRGRQAEVHREHTLSQDSDDLYGPPPVINAVAAQAMAEIERYCGPPLESARGPTGGLVRSSSVAGIPQVRLEADQPERTKWVRASGRPAAEEPLLSGVIVRPASNVDSQERQAEVRREQSLSQDSDVLYGPLPVIDAATAWIMAEAEGHHGRPLESARGPPGGLVRSSTLADIPRVSNKGFTFQVKRCASQPEGTSAQRAAGAQRIRRQRLERTAKLNKYVPAMKDKCAAHMLEMGELVNDHFPAPCFDLQTSGEAYQAFRRRFVFKRYTYCYTCGLPQDQNFNEEGPECHKEYAPGGERKCPFQHVVFKTAFVAGQKTDLLDAMREAFEIPGETFEQYLDWVTSNEEEDGRYHNAIEVFLWCCEQTERQRPTLFL